MLTTPRFWRVEHPSWSVIYRVPEALGPRPNAADVEIVGHAVAFARGRHWYQVLDANGEAGELDLAWVATVRIAPWPRDRAAFMAFGREHTWHPTRFVADAATWTALPQAARGALRDAVHWEKVPGALRSDVVARSETGLRIRALARSYSVVLEEERVS